MSEKIIMDAHFDILCDVLYHRERGETKVLENRFLSTLKMAGINALVCSIFIDDCYLPEMALRRALDQISALKSELDESPDFFALCRDTKEARVAASEGKIALFLSFEGVEPLGNDISLLRIFYDLGVRLVGLTWSRRNYAADGSVFEPEYGPKRAGGLTRFGRLVTAEAQRLGMVIDVSHLNDPGFFEVADLIKGPFIASHSDCRALCGAARNLTDEQLAVLAQHGGVTGMNACAMFSSDKKEERTPQKLLEHLDHVVRTAGQEHAGLGLDICECLSSFKAQAQDNGFEESDLFKDHIDARKNFIDPIIAKYPEETADAILGGNFMRVLEEVLG